MNYYKLKISYAGQNYLGWQIQKDSKLTIQGQLEQSIVAATGIKRFKTRITTFNKISLHKKSVS